MIRIAIAGTGSMGLRHARALAAIPGARVVAVLGRDPRRTAAFAQGLDTRPYTDLDAMLEGEQIDAIDCCLPTPLHRRAVEKAAARGLHAICEKPLALSVADGRAMIEAARVAGTSLLIAQVVRFFPEFRRLAAAVEDAQIGAPVSLTLLRQGFFPTGRDGWYRDTAQSGGIFLDLMVHDFDWALHALGPADRVYARLVQAQGPESFAQGMATIRHRSGAISQITGTWGHPGPFTTMAEVAGEGGLLRHHSGDTRALTAMVSTNSEEESVPLPDLVAGEDPYRTELAHFVDVIAGHAEPVVAPEEALAAIALAIAARRSAETGRAFADWEGQR